MCDRLNMLCVSRLCVLSLLNILGHAQMLQTFSIMFFYCYFLEIVLS